MATTHPARPDHPPTPAPARRRRWVAACGSTARRPSCARTRSAPARASSPPTARSSCAPASTPAGRRRTSSSSTSRRAATRSGGARSTGRSARRTTTGSAPASWPTAPRRTSTPRTCIIGADPAHQRRLRVYTETAWASMFARNLFRRPSAGGPRRLRAELHDHLRPVVQGRPGHGGHPHRDRDPGPPRADGDPHRRHRVRGRDQEVGLHGHELPHAGRGRPADALVGQRRQGGRLGRVLRPSRDGQDHAVRRPGAQPHRRRRARLGRRTASSTSRAAATPRPSASPRCTSPTSSRRPSASGRSSRTSTSTPTRASSTSTPSGSPRTPAAPTRSTSSATPTRPG